MDIKIKANEVTQVDVKALNIKVPKGHRVGIKVNHDTYWSPNNPQVSKYNGFLLKGTDEGYLTFPKEFYAEHTLYMFSDSEETIVIFKTVPDSWEPKV